MGIHKHDHDRWDLLVLALETLLDIIRMLPDLILGRVVQSCRGADLVSVTS